MKKLLLSLAMATVATSFASAQQASFDHPIGLRYLGTIKNPDVQPACSYLSRNPMNDGAFLWAPVGSKVKYTNTSDTEAQSWNWTTPGGTLEDATAKDAIIKYAEPGTYTFPTLTANFASGAKTATYDHKLKVGGRAELCLADCRVWTVTYGLGTQYYDNQNGAVNGSLGGTNNLNIAGVGNLYMTSLEDGFLDGVNIYLPKKPTKYKEGAKIRVQIWMPSIGENEMVLTYMPIDGWYTNFEDIKTSEDGAWVPVEGGAVIQLKCSSPIDLYGKQMLFISVDGWSNDPTTEDFCMLMDVMPNKTMEPEDANNLLAHNSFVRLNNENDFLRPVSYYGGNYGSFMICPVVRGGETPSSALAQVSADYEAKMGCTVDGGVITLTGADGHFEVYNMSGMACVAGEITGGSAEIQASALTPGIYVARNAAGQTVKFVTK